MAFDDEILDDLNKEPRNNDANEELHMGLRVLSFCIPIAGAIIYFTTNERFPKKKNQACTAALWGIGINMVLRILTAIGGGL